MIFGVFIAREGSSPEQMRQLRTGPNRSSARTRTSRRVHHDGELRFLSSNQGITFSFLRPAAERLPIANWPAR